MEVPFSVTFSQVCIDLEAGSGPMLIASHCLLSDCQHTSGEAHWALAHFSALSALCFADRPLH